MTDLICRKSMTRCLTPGMCSPHGGCQAAEHASAFRTLLAERNSLTFLLKRFVDGEHDQDENQAERHMYHDEAQTLLAYLDGDLQGRSLVPDEILRVQYEQRMALIVDNETLVVTAQSLRDEWRKDQADAGRYQFIADNACDVSFYVANTDSGDGDTMPGPRVELTQDQYPVEMFGTGKAKLDFAVDAMMTGKDVATPSTDKENVSRYAER